MVFRDASGQCARANEVCGDGIDQDCDGSDLACASPDRDLDGYSDSSDCDPLDRSIFPGVYSACGTTGAAGTKLCQTNGQFTACTTVPLCEATGTGKCYYISSTTGADGNAGTFQSPWRSLNRIGTFACDTASSTCAGDRPLHTPVRLAAGDVVYLLGGLYSTSMRNNQVTASLYMANVSGTESAPIKIRNYPGTNPLISPTARVGGIYFENVSNIQIEGLEISRTYGDGYTHHESSNVILSGVWIHDCDGVDNFNLSGIKIGNINNFTLKNSILNDNYDRTCQDTNGQPTENSRNMVIFGSNTVRIKYNVIFQTPPINASKTGACLGYKHDATGTAPVFEVKGNTFSNCFDAAIQSYTHNGTYTDNRIFNSTRGFRIWTSGDFTDLRNHLIERNLFIETQPLDYRPSGVLGNGHYGNVTFRRNTVKFTGPYSNDVAGVINIDPYGDPSVLAVILNPGQFQASENCYYNPAGEAKFGMFRAIPGGGLYNLAGWKSLGLDSGSVEVNPAFDAKFVPTNPTCQGRFPQSN